MYYDQRSLEKVFNRQERQLDIDTRRHHLWVSDTHHFGHGTNIANNVTQTVGPPSFTATLGQTLEA